MERPLVKIEDEWWNQFCMNVIPYVVIRNPPMWMNQTTSRWRKCEIIACGAKYSANISSYYPYRDVCGREYAIIVPTNVEFETWLQQ